MDVSLDDVGRVLVARWVGERVGGLLRGWSGRG